MFTRTNRGFGKAAQPSRALAPGGVSRPGAAFMRGGNSKFFANYLPPLRETREDVRISWHNAAARATDLLQNSGFIAGGIEQAVAYTVGSGLNLNAQPDAAVLGMTASEASDWSRLVERKFEAWANRPIECDIEGKKKLGQQAASALRQWFATGEIVSILRWKSVPGARYRTKVALLPSSRLSQQSRGDDVFQGVRIDADGMPLAYRFSKLTARQSYEAETEIRARDAAGRPRVTHVFDGLPGQVRGISPMTPAIHTARQFDQLTGATLEAALIQAIMVGTVYSDTPSPELLEAFRDEQEQRKAKDGEALSALGGMLAQRADYYDAAKIDIGRFGKISHLFSGDKFEFHGAKHPNENFDSFATFLLREIARCLGISYEDLTGDYNGVTYQSMLHSTASMWLMVLLRRAFIVSPFLQDNYDAWLEEAIDLGEVPFPGGLDGFIANRTAATRTHWRGRGRPLTDPLKTARAFEIMKRIGVITDEAIANELGVDLEDLYEQLEREREMRRQRGLPDTAQPDLSASSNAAAVADDAAQDAADDAAQDKGSGGDA